MAMMLKMVKAQGLVLWGLCCVLQKYLWNKGQGEGIPCLALEPEGNMGFPRFRAFLLLFFILCFPISLSKSPRVLAAKPGCALREGI